MHQEARNHHTITIAAILANDDKALEALYNANYYKTASFVLANKGTEEEAKDIFQEAFLATWKNIQAGRFVPQKDTSVEAYLFQIARYKWYDHLKAAKKIQSVPVEDYLQQDEPYSEEEDAYIQTVQQHFKKMGEPCKQVLKLFYFMKQSMASIATQFSWTEATAKNNKYRCLQRLRNLVVGKQ